MRDVFFILHGDKTRLLPKRLLLFPSHTAGLIACLLTPLFFSPSLLLEVLSQSHPMPSSHRNSLKPPIAIPWGHSLHDVSVALWHWMVTQSQGTHLASLSPVK